ncbi:MAG: tetratricopeptide repeat protein [Archangium sp.]|nr:tetratricopeptide repeat protein [Archangium sp.]
MGLALSACATDSASRTELSTLALELRTARSDNARLENRLDKLEQQLAVALARPQPKPATAPQALAVNEPSKPESAELPPLTVVKLKPKKEKAPALPLEVDIAEPPEGLAAAVAVTEATNPPVDEAQAVVADGLYDSGLAALKTGDVEGGIKTLQSFAAEWPKHPRADNALYFAGIGQLALKDVDAAEKTFHGVITRYPAGDALLDSLLKLAECKVKLNRQREARATWEKIIASFPGTAAATQAQQRLAAVPAAKTGAPD